MYRFRALLGSRWLKLAISVGLLTVLVRQTDFTVFRAVVAGAQAGWMLAAFAAYVASQVVSTFRWRILARPLGFTEPFGRFFTCYFAGMYLNLFGPSTVAGDIGRALFLAAGKRRDLAVTSVVVHRGIGLLALFCIGAVAVLCFPRYPIARPVYAAAWLTPVLALLVWLRGPLWLARRFPTGHRVRFLIEKEARVYWQDRRLFLISFFLAVIMHLMKITTQAWIGTSLGLRIPWSFFFVFFPLVDIAGMLPITIGGIGVREAGYWYFLPAVAVANDQALALGLLSSAIVLITSLLGAPFLLLVGRGEPGEATVNR